MHWVVAVRHTYIVVYGHIYSSITSEKHLPTIDIHTYIHIQSGMGNVVEFKVDELSRLAQGPRKMLKRARRCIPVQGAAFHSVSCLHSAMCRVSCSAIFLFIHVLILRKEYTNISVFIRTSEVLASSLHDANVC